MATGTDRGSRGRWTLMGLALLLSMMGFAACAGQPACERNSDCEEGYCSNGACEKDCVVAELDCPRGFICNALSQCEDPNRASTSATGGGEGGMGGASASNSTRGAGGGGPSTTGAGGGATTTGAGGGAATLGELEVCVNSNQCSGNLQCRPMTKGGTKRCTNACVSSAQCPAGMKCIDDGTGQHCYFSDVGRSCTMATQCNFACIMGVNYCTTQCSTGADCPNGYGCMPIGSPAQNVCVKAEALCDTMNASACIAPAACDTTNLLLSSCTTTCNTAADCPQRAAGLAPWTCDGLCRRPADVYGGLPGGYQPAEYYCDALMNPIVLCNDAQHMDFQTFTIPAAPAVNCGAPVSTPGSANDACVNSCTYQGGCADGFTCVGVGNINGGRIGLCLPHGTKEPGQACTSNTECAFGYCFNGLCSRDCTQDNLCPGGQTCTAGGGPNIEGLPFKRCQ